MNILLVNKNPVVSRLLSFCTRDASIELEEVEEVERCSRDRYDVVFVDEASYIGSAKNLSQYPSLKKRVLFTHTDITSSDFDMLIPKPFLPSEILDIFESLSEHHNKEESLKPAQVLDNSEVEKIKELLEENEIDYDSSDEILSDEELEARKVKAIKEQLIAQGLEIVEEKEILEELEVDSPSESIKLSDEENLFLDKVKRKKMKNRSSKKKSKHLAHKKDDLIVQAVEIAMRSLKKKQRKKLLNGKEIKIKIKLEGKK
jgi:hypothetical protein